MTGPSDRDGAGKGLGRALGVFSVALGAAQLVAPRKFARLIGVDADGATPTLVRAVGAREAAAGIGLLASPTSARWMWARVAGDAIDLALLATAFSRDAEDRTRVTAAIAGVAGVSVPDIIGSARLSRNGASAEKPVVAAITVNRPREEVYAFWRDLENLPAFMAHLESVELSATDGTSHWKARGPAGRTVEWDAELVEDRPPELISWRSLDAADVRNSGTVRFSDAPGARGTEVRVELQYAPPGGRLGSGAAKLLGEEPTQQAKDDLRRFKQVLETGEVVRSEGTPEGTFAGRQLEQRPAQPLAEAAPSEGGMQ